MRFLLKWLVSTLVITVAAYLIPGVQVDTLVAALIAALVLGLCNAIIKPILVLLTLPLTVMTLGLFIIVINALLVLLTDAIVPGFSVANFWWAAVFSLVVSVLSIVLNQITKD